MSPITDRGASDHSGVQRPILRGATRALPSTLLAALLTSSSVVTQHAETVLFGEPSEAGLALPAERTAVHPISAPYYNEDAFVTTDLRF